MYIKWLHLSGLISLQIKEQQDGILKQQDQEVDQEIDGKLK
jgi:hypothetical protein